MAATPVATRLASPSVAGRRRISREAGSPRAPQEPGAKPRPLRAGDPEGNAGERQDRRLGEEDQDEDGLRDFRRVGQAPDAADQGRQRRRERGDAGQGERAEDQEGAEEAGHRRPTVRALTRPGPGAGAVVPQGRHRPGASLHPVRGGDARG